MTNDLLIYSEKFAHFLIYWEALPKVWLCTRSHLNFLIYEENFSFLFISVGRGGGGVAAMRPDLSFRLSWWGKSPGWEEILITKCQHLLMPFNGLDGLKNNSMTDGVNKWVFMLYNFTLYEKYKITEWLHNFACKMHSAPCGTSRRPTLLPGRFSLEGDIHGDIPTLSIKGRCKY